MSRKKDRLGRLPVQAVLEYLRDDRVLEQGAAKRVGAQLPGLLDADEVARKSNVVEIQLGRLDQALSDVGVIRRKRKGDVAGFQDCEPLPCGGM